VEWSVTTSNEIQKECVHSRKHIRSELNTVVDICTVMAIKSAAGITADGLKSVLQRVGALHSALYCMTNTTLQYCTHG
jgi:hypothetical protein